MMSDAKTVAEPTARAWAIGLIQELGSCDPGWELAVEGWILVGLGRLQRLHARRAMRPRWLDDAIDLARRKESLPTIAERIGRHPSHVAREFRRHQGVSVGEYVRRCRLEVAATSLRKSGDPIAAVALAAGFCDQSHFTKAFHRVFGVTPAEYRRVANRERSMSH
jgi:AraC family transcriptional regulator